MSENTSTPAPYSVTVDVGGRPLTLETGKIAKQANGAITARYGDTIVLTAGTYVNVVRIIPPLVTTADEVDQALRILDESLAAAGA